MKKFLILSAIVGLAGIGAGIVRQHETATTTVEAVTATSSTTVTTVPPTSPPTTVRKVLAKATPTTTRQVSTPTTVAATITTAATTNTTIAPTTTTKAWPTANCSVSAANASVHKGDSQMISVTSDRPMTKTRLTIHYPTFNTGKPNPTQTFTPTTDDSGAVTQNFVVADTSTVPVAVTVEFFDPATSYTMRGGCTTSFQTV